ncbi:MAG TPA: hypothetical protein VHB79_20595 [Polyangiaceae bacterium]|nr:hypothetical protein [Polyangiaceae bacterium]
MRDELTKSLAGLWLLLGFAQVACSSDTPADGAGTSGSAAQAGSNAGASSSGGSAAGGTSSSHAGSGSAGKSFTAGGSTAGDSTGGSSQGGNSTGTANSADCGDPGLTWKSANKTWYESYPDPGSEECIKYNGCTWAGEFSACDGKKPEAWVQTHDIVSAFPDFDTLQLHDLCLRSGDKTLVVTVLDTCGDDDCDGCCTQNLGDADELIDIESYTNDRWGVDDGRIEWADLGPTRGDGCN